MAESDKVKHSDIIEDQVFQPTIAEGKELLQVLKDLEAGFKGILIATGKKITIVDPKNVDDVEKLNDAFKKTDDTVKGMTETQRKRLALEKQLAALTSEEAIGQAKLKEQIKEQTKANKDLAREQLGLVSAYQKASKELNDLRNAYKNLTIAGREQGVVGRGLLQAVQEQDTKLKTLDATVGQHQRNVGNYTGAMKGLGGILINTAKLFGINEDAIHSIEQAYKNSVKILQGFKLVKRAVSEETVMETAAVLKGAVAKTAETGATTKLTIAQRILNAVRAAGVGTIGLIVAGLAVLATATIGIINAIIDNTKEEKERQKAIDGTIIKNDELRKQYNESVFSIQKLNVEYKKLTGTLNDTQAASALLGIEYSQLLQGFKEDTKTKLEETKTFWNALVTVIGLSGKVFEEQQQIIKDEAALTFSKLKELKLKTLIDDKKDKQEIEELEREKWREIEKLRVDAIKDDTKRKIENLKLQARFDIEDVEKTKLSENTKYNFILAINNKLTTDLQEINEDLAEKKRKLEMEEWEHLRKLDEMERKAMDDMSKARLKAMEKRYAEEEKLRVEKIGKEIEEREKLLGNLMKIEAENADIGKTEDELRLEEIKAQYSREGHLLVEARKKGIITEEEYRAASIKLEQNYQEQIKGLNKKRLDEEIKLVDSLNDAVFDGLEKRDQRRQQMLDKELKQIDDAIKKQQDLANRGLDNTLAFEEKRRAEAIAKKAELEKRARRQEQAQQLANVFLEFLKSYAKEGAIGAPAKALAQTLIAKGISELIAGTFAEGVEDLPGRGTATSDSNLALLSKGESVVTAAGTRENPGLATAMNEGGVMEYFKDTYMPQLNTQLMADASKRSQLAGAMLGLLDDRLRSLEKTVKHKKEISINWDEHGNMVRQEVEAGLRRHITGKRRAF